MINALLDVFKGFNFSVNDFDIIMSKMEPVEYKKHELILQENAPCDYIYFITKGLVRGYGVDAEGKEKTLWVHTANRFITDYKAFLTRGPVSTIMEALQDCDIYRISWSSMQYLYKAVPEFNTFSRVVTEQYFIKLIDEIKMLQSNPSPLVRYEVFMQLHEGISEQIPQHMIADIINVSPVHLSRLKSTYAKKKMPGRA